MGNVLLGEGGLLIIYLFKTLFQEEVGILQAAFHPQTM